MAQSPFALTDGFLNTSLYADNPVETKIQSVAAAAEEKAAYLQQLKWDSKSYPEQVGQALWGGLETVAGITTKAPANIAQSFGQGALEPDSVLMQNQASSAENNLRNLARQIDQSVKNTGIVNPALLKQHDIEQERFNQAKSWLNTPIDTSQTSGVLGRFAPELFGADYTRADALAGNQRVAEAVSPLTMFGNTLKESAAARVPDSAYATIDPVMDKYSADAKKAWDEGNAVTGTLGFVGNTLLGIIDAVATDPKAATLKASESLAQSMSAAVPGLNAVVFGSQYTEDRQDAYKNFQKEHGGKLPNASEAAVIDTVIAASVASDFAGDVFMVKALPGLKQIFKTKADVIPDTVKAAVVSKYPVLVATIKEVGKVASIPLEEAVQGGFQNFSEQVAAKQDVNKVDTKELSKAAIEEGVAATAMGGGAALAVPSNISEAKTKNDGLKQTIAASEAFKQTEAYKPFSEIKEAPVAAFRAFETVVKDEASTPEQKQAAFDTAFGALVNTPQFNTQKIASTLIDKVKDLPDLNVEGDVATTLASLAKPTLGVIGKTGDVISKGIDAGIQQVGKLKDSYIENYDISDKKIEKDPIGGLRTLSQKPIHAKNIDELKTEGEYIFKTLNKLQESFATKNPSAAEQAEYTGIRDEIFTRIETVASQFKSPVTNEELVTELTSTDAHKKKTFGSSQDALPSRLPELTVEQLTKLEQVSTLQPELKKLVTAFKVAKTTSAVSDNIRENSDGKKISLKEYASLLNLAILSNNKVEATNALGKLAKFAKDYAEKTKRVGESWDRVQGKDASESVTQINPKETPLDIHGIKSINLVKNIAGDNKAVQAQLQLAQYEFNKAFNAPAATVAPTTPITPNKSSTTAPAVDKTGLLEKLRNRLSEIYKKDVGIGSDTTGNYLSIKNLSINDSNIGYYFQRAGYQIFQSSQTGDTSKFYYKDVPEARLKYVALRAIGWTEKEIKKFFATNQKGYSLKQAELAGYRSPNGTSYNIAIDKYLPDGTIDIRVIGDSTSIKGNKGSIKTTSTYNIQPIQLKDIEELFVKYLADNVLPKKEDGTSFPYPGNWVSIPAIDLLIKEKVNGTKTQETIPTEQGSTEEKVPAPVIENKVPVEQSSVALKASPTLLGKSYIVGRNIKNILYKYASTSIRKKNKKNEVELLEAEKEALRAIPEYTFKETLFNTSENPIQTLSAVFKDNKDKVEEIITLLSKTISSNINNTNQLYLSQNPALAFMQDLGDTFKNTGNPKLTMQKQVVDAIAVAAFNYIGTQGRSLMVNDITSLKMMFGIDSKKDLPEGISEIMLHAGKNINSVSDDIGVEVYQLLGMQISDEIARKRMQHSLGFMAIKGLQNLGYLQQNNIDKKDYDSLLQAANSDKESDTDVEADMETGADRVIFVSTKLQRKNGNLVLENKRVVPTSRVEQLFSIYKQENLSKDIKDALGLRGSVIKPRTEKPTDAAIPKFLKNTKQALSKKAIETIKVANSTPYTFNTKAFDTFLSIYNEPTLQDALLESLGYVADLNTVSMYKRKSTQATNQLLLKEIDSLIEYHNLLTDKTANVYFTHYISKVNRVFIDNTSGINPQGSKLVRHFITQNNQDIILDKSNPKFEQHLNDTLAAIALGFDIDSGNTSRDKVLTQLKDLIEKDSPIKTYLDNPTPEALIVVLKKFKGKSHTLEALIALEQLQYFNKDSAATKLTLRTTNEVDGKTNGVAIAVAQTFGIGSKDLPGILKQIGLISEGTPFQYLDAMKGDLDLYQTIVERWSKNVKDRMAEQLTPAEVGVWSTQQRYLGNLMKLEDGVEVVTKDARNMVKYPFMTTIFGKSAQTLQADFGKELISAIYKKIEALNKNLQEGGFADEIFGDIEQINQDIQTLVGRKLKPEILFPKTLTFIDHRLPLGIENAIGKSVENTYGEELGYAIDAQFKPFFDTRVVLNTAVNTVSDIFIQMVKNKAGTSQLTKALLDELMVGELKEFLPAFKTAHAETIQEGYLALKAIGMRTPKNGVEVTYALETSGSLHKNIINNPLTDTNAEELSKPTKSHSGGIKEVTLQNAGVGALIGMIHSFDGAVMQEILTQLKAFGVHDAAILNALTSQEDSVIMNKIFAEVTEKYSIAESINERFNEVRDALLKLESDPNQTLLTKDQLRDALVGMEEVIQDRTDKKGTHAGLQNTITKIKADRARILPSVVSWTQMVGYNSAYIKEGIELPVEVAPTVETLIAEVAPISEEIAKPSFETKVTALVEQAFNSAVSVFLANHKSKKPQKRTIARYTKQVSKGFQELQIGKENNFIDSDADRAYLDATIYTKIIELINTATPEQKQQIKEAFKCRGSK